MSNIFDSARSDPMVPVPLTPLAAAEGGDDDGGGDAGGGLGLDFFISLGASLGTLADTAAADRAERQARSVAPGNNPLFASGVAPASGNVVLDLGSVPQGRVWQIRRLIVGGATVIATADGAAYAFGQGAPPADLALTNCMDIFLTLPQGNTYGTHQLFLTRGEHFWVVFTGATMGQQYSASARVEDWDESTYFSTFAE